MARVKKSTTQTPTNGRSEIRPTRAADYRGAVDTDVYVPDLGTRTEAAPLPRLRVRPPWLFAWSLSGWMVMAGRLIPALRTVRLSPGINKVARGRDGRTNLAECRAHLEARGWRFLAPELGPDGSYLRRVACDPTGTGNRAHTYISAWETAHAGSDRCTVDEDGYAAWCASLVEQGVIPPCPVVVARGLEEKAASRVARMEGEVAAGKHSLRKRLEMARAELQVISDYIEAQHEAAPAVESEVASVEVSL